MAKKSKKKEIKYFFGIALFALIVCCVIVVLYFGIRLIVNPTDIMIVEKGSVSSEESGTGYVIRQETIIEGTNCDKIKNEGEKVSVGSDVFRYYTTDEESINNQITELNKQIQEALDGQVNLFQNDVKVLENQIANKIDEIECRNNIQEILEYKRDINGYMSKISKIAGESSQSGSYISNLVAQRTELETKLSNSSKYIKSDVSGIISYRIDGFEGDLSIDKISTLTSDYLENLTLKKGQIAPTTNGMCKIINNYECYIAVPSNSKEALETRHWKKSNIKIINTRGSTSRSVYSKYR